MAADPRPLFRLLADETRDALTRASKQGSTLRDASLSKPVVIVVESEIGGGKTTAVDEFARMLRTTLGVSVETSKEPSDDWERVGILQRFYSDPARWAAEFQLYVLVTRITSVMEMWERNPNADVYLLERSVFADYYYFVRIQYEHSATFDPVQLAMYQRWWAMWLRLMPFEISAFLRLDVPIDELMARWLKRSRPGETFAADAEHHDEGVQQMRAYQLLLKRAHDAFFEQLVDPTTLGLPAGVRSMQLDNSEDYRVDAAVHARVSGQLASWLRHMLPSRASSPASQLTGSPLGSSPLGSSSVNLADMSEQEMVVLRTLLDARLADLNDTPAGNNKSVPHKRSEPKPVAAEGD